MFEAQVQKVTAVAAENAADVDKRARFPEEAVSALRDSGLFGLTISAEAGGLGAGPSEFFDVVRGIAGSCASTAMIYLMHVCAAQVTAAAPPSEGGNQTLLEMASGARLSTLALSERGSRSHFWAPVSRLEGPDGNRLKAEKSFVTSAGKADSFVVSTRPVGTESPVESSLYLVGADTDGVRFGSPWMGLGLRGNESGPMTFDVEVNDGMRLGEAGGGFDLMLGVVLPWFQLGSGAVSLGIAESAVKATVAHITGARLEHLGETLADLPTVRARVGRAQTEVDQTAGFLSDLSRRMAAGDATAPVLSAKAAANEMSQQVTAECMQACGGAGMSSLLPIERNFRDARAGSVMAPTTDVLYELTGRALAGMPMM
jgi:alkylation response protein AidB-like acyl-CoA dehydrogenase